MSYFFLACQSSSLISLNVKCFLHHWTGLSTSPMVNRLIIYQNPWQETLYSSLNFLEDKPNRSSFLVLKSLVSRPQAVYKTLLISLLLHYYSSGKWKLTFISKKLSLLRLASHAFYFTISIKTLSQTNNIKILSRPVASKIASTVNHYCDLN